jgi:hypothetical protein
MQEYMPALPSWLRCMSERTFAWVLLWISIVVSFIILELQVVVPGSA